MAATDHTVVFRWEETNERESQEVRLLCANIQNAQDNQVKLISPADGNKWTNEIRSDHN